MTAGGVLLSLLAVLGVALGGLWLWLSGRAQREDAITRSRLSHGERSQRRVRGFVEDHVRGTRPGRALQLRLHAAGVEWGIADLLVLQLGGAAAGLLIGWMLGLSTLGVVLAVAAIAAPLVHLERERGRRRERFIAQLPDLARAMSGASSAGLSLRSALDLVASELNEPAASELDRVTDELALGQSVDHALAGLGDRMPSREVSVLVATLVVQHRAGGDLVAALRNMASTLDQRKDLRREIRTLLSGTVATGYVVATLGAVSLVLVSVASPDTVPVLLGSWLGRLVIVVALALYAAGFTLISRLTRIEA